MREGKLERKRAAAAERKKVHAEMRALAAENRKEEAEHTRTSGDALLLEYGAENISARMRGILAL